MRSGFCYAAILMVTLTASAQAYNWSTNPGNGTPDTSSSGGFQGTAFTGRFIGNGFSIYNLTIESPVNDCIGLFRQISNSGLLIGLGLENATIGGDIIVGVLCGLNENGIITNCSITKGIITGNYFYSGGLCGNNRGTITRCSTNVAIMGNEHVGGLCGKNEGIISSCFASGAVTGINGSSPEGSFR